jgi:hypothetical protein
MRTDRHDEAHSLSSRFCERALKSAHFCHVHIIFKKKDVRFKVILHLPAPDFELRTIYDHT